MQVKTKVRAVAPPGGALDSLPVGRHLAPRVELCASQRR